jgi:hypothetical protein
VTAIQRPRKVAVSSQRVSSQPATDGGAKRRWPPSSPIQAHESVRIELRSARSRPAVKTTGGFVIRGPS